MTGDEQVIGSFRDMLDHHLTADFEANLTLYYADQGQSYDPNHLGLHREFHT